MAALRPPQAPPRAPQPPQKVVTLACFSAGNSALAEQWVAPWQPMLFFLVRVPVPYLDGLLVCRL